MNCLLGTLALALGAAASAVAALAWPRSGGRRTARVATAAALACAAAAFAVLETALLTRDFGVGFVAGHGGRDVSPYYTLTSLWSGLEGSMVLWLLALAGFAWAAGRERADDPRRPVAMTVIMLVCACFFALTLLAANPFQPAAPVPSSVPADGPGPNPLLRGHPLMGIHPPLLYLGYTGLVVPFAYGVASLLAGDAGRDRVRTMRRWTLVAWIPLTAGIVLGAWWSYGVLGWGGYWEWDPVENASLVPWLVATALLHSLMVQERRGALRRWNVSLAVAAFLLVLLGTFLTRSGAVSSVHSFTTSAIGPALLGLLTAALVATGGLLARHADRPGAGPGLRPGFSRDLLFLVNNVLLVTLAFTVVLGTLAPLVVEAVRGTPVAVGPPYFDRMTIPPALALLALMAAAPLVPWARADRRVLARRLRVPLALGALTVTVLGLTGSHRPLPLLAFGLGAFTLAAVAVRAAETVRWRRGVDRRRLGGLLVHAGIALAAVAITGSSAYAQEGRARLATGQVLDVGGYRVRLDGTEEERTRDSLTGAARVSLSRDGSPLGVFRPSLVLYPATGAPPVANPAVRTGPFADVYITVTEIDPATRSAEIGVAVNPLMALLWTAGALLVAGGVAAVPRRRRAALAAPAGAPGAAREGAGAR
ncbi:heme lyase CcmF/NrfE family subunit [Microtetraspora niveoalba]|uniref:heme lyase CcmF/NrfE family subunit n=1 Tax=Microtetraspora niveoalba TaxID=46175 RepID=UPI000A074DE9|nr:cytochrome c-type biogenesis CcmF C-terminal domain-containing protein [Microtetraspora niveoalba]